MYAKSILTMLLLLCFNNHAMNDKASKTQEQTSYHQVRNPASAQQINLDDSKRRCGEIVCTTTLSGALLGVCASVGSIVCIAYNPLYWWMTCGGCCAGCMCGTCCVCIRDGHKAFCYELLEIIIEDEN